MKQVSVIRQIALCAVLLGIVALVWYAPGPLGTLLSPSGQAQATEGQRAQSGVPVIVAEVEQQQDILTFSAIGTGDAQRSITLRAPSSGRIIDVGIAPGMKFEAGNVLLRLEDTDEQLAVSLAEVRLEQARSERDRILSLRQTGNAAAARFETAETDFQIAQIELDQARADLADRTLEAPFDGYAGLTVLEAGDRVAEDAEITTFDDRSRILVEFDVPEALLGRMTPGLKVEATTPAVERETFDGEVMAIDSRVDASTRTARVRVAIENPADMLRPGASFAINVDLAGRDFPAVPELALQFSRGSLTVWRVVNGVAEAVDVQLVRRRAGIVLIDGPISPGDRVVIEGTQRLRPGASVTVLNDPVEGNS
jgi:RND family efflux transporter MFP subunit